MDRSEKDLAVLCMDKVKGIACYKLWLSQLLQSVSFKEKRLVSKTKRCTSWQFYLEESKPQENNLCTEPAVACVCFAYKSKHLLQPKQTQALPKSKQVVIDMQSTTLKNGLTYCLGPYGFEP